ncbi:hypothetical protein ABW19_dt0201750 [Dactylella cylindrospora]|nr:hypothetical protein ABW19_dt0201750 [Dactylella cylindrospora]
MAIVIRNFDISYIACIGTWTDGWMEPLPEIAGFSSQACKFDSIIVPTTQSKERGASSPDSFDTYPPDLLKSLTLMNLKSLEHFPEGLGGSYQTPDITTVNIERSPWSSEARRFDQALELRKPFPLLGTVLGLRSDISTARNTFLEEQDSDSGAQSTDTAMVEEKQVQRAYECGERSLRPSAQPPSTQEGSTSPDTAVKNLVIHKANNSESLNRYLLLYTTRSIYEKFNPEDIADADRKPLKIGDLIIGAGSSVEHFLESELQAPSASVIHPSEFSRRFGCPFGRFWPDQYADCAAVNMKWVTSIKDHLQHHHSHEVKLELLGPGQSWDEVFEACIPNISLELRPSPYFDFSPLRSFFRCNVEERTRNSSRLDPTIPGTLGNGNLENATLSGSSEDLESYTNHALSPPPVVRTTLLSDSAQTKRRRSSGSEITLKPNRQVLRLGVRTRDELEQELLEYVAPTIKVAKEESKENTGEDVPEAAASFQAVFHAKVSIMPREEYVKLLAAMSIVPIENPTGGQQCGGYGGSASGQSNNKNFAHLISSGFSLVPGQSNTGGDGNGGIGRQNGNGGNGGRDRGGPQRGNNKLDEEDEERRRYGCPFQRIGHPNFVLCGKKTVKAKNLAQLRQHIKRYHKDSFPGGESSIGNGSGCRNWSSIARKCLRGWPESLLKQMQPWAGEPTLYQQLTEADQRLLTDILNGSGGSANGTVNPSARDINSQIDPDTKMNDDNSFDNDDAPAELLPSSSLGPRQQGIQPMSVPIVAHGSQFDPQMSLDKYPENPEKVAFDEEAWSFFEDPSSWAAADPQSLLPTPGRADQDDSGEAGELPRRLDLDTATAPLPDSTVGMSGPPPPAIPYHGTPAFRPTPQMDMRDEPYAIIVYPKPNNNSMLGTSDPILLNFKNINDLAENFDNYLKNKLSGHFIDPRVCTLPDSAQLHVDFNWNNWFLTSMDQGDIGDAQSLVGYVKALPNTSYKTARFNLAKRSS